MDRLYTLRELLGWVFLAAAFPSVRGQVDALMTISNLPEIGRHRDLFIYAIYPSPSDGGAVEITDPSHGRSPALGRGLIKVGTDVIGRWLRGAGGPTGQKSDRYGRYEASYTFGNGDMWIKGETFVRPVTDFLDTQGLYTVTIYPESNSGTNLAKPVSIGVKLAPGCNKIIWCKGRKRNVHTGARMTLTSVEDAGLYTIARPGRGKRGWFVQIRVTASPCQRGWYRSDAGVCMEGSFCMNGGVLKSDEDGCLCPPFYFGVDCSSSTKDYTPNPFVLVSLGHSSKLYCRDLPGGHPECKGYLICKGDNYGCKCATGWWGNACDRPCPKRKYGPGCKQQCPDEAHFCNRFFGPENMFEGSGSGSGDGWQ